MKMTQFFPPALAVEGIKSVPSVCLSVCVSVIQLSHGWTVWRMDLKICVRINIDKILDEFEHQGHRSKVKVTVLKNVIFYNFGMSVLERLWGKNTDKDTSREGASTLRRFHLILFFDLQSMGDLQIVYLNFKVKKR